MAIKTKEERQARRQKRKSDRKSKVYVDDVYSTDNCVDDECRAFDKQGFKLPKWAGRQDKVNRGKKDKANKFYSVEVSAIDAPTYTEETSEPGMDVTHRRYGSNTPAKSTDYTPDDSAANLAKVESIGGSVTSEVGSAVAGSETTIQGSGMKEGYVSQQLYKKTKSGELKAKKGVKYEGQSMLGGASSILADSARITRRGHETEYKSTRGMSGKEKRTARKRAYELDPENTTRYVSPVQNFTYATDTTIPYNYATPTDNARKFAGSSTRINRKKNKTQTIYKY